MEIIWADSLVWLPANIGQGSVITSLPEATELGMENIQEYIAWFTKAARLCFLSASEDCPLVFSQTDRKAGGQWLDKAHLLHCVADNLGFHCLWHKIELRLDAGKVVLMRPGYRHLIAFGKGKVRPGPVSEDVIRPGPTLYADGLNYRAAELAVSLCLRHTNKIVDPFCGRGTVPAIAERLGAHSTGVDISEEQCSIARALTGTAVDALRVGDMVAVKKEQNIVSQPPMFALENPIAK